MKVKNLFTLLQGNGLELMNMELSETSNINFVSRTAQNNGVVAQVVADTDIEPFPAGYITVALGGSVLSAFVQRKPFYTAFHVMALKPNKEMKLQEKLYYCMCIQGNAYRYNYGRQANKTLKNIELPDSVPEWVYTLPIKPVRTKVQRKELLLLNVHGWKEFRIGNLFRLERCKNSVSGDLSDGDDCFYLGAKKSENGVMRRVTRDESVVSKGNCIVFIGNGQGSVGYTNYMNDDFIGTADLTVGYNEHLNKYNGMFVVTLLDLERPKYSFGRKWSSRMANTIIKLPAKGDSPDWNYMEQHIKSLPYSDRI
ncbi:MAG: restriction endonuclease subunit S [Peptococcaceae bacterium]|nr:restriction endonuclease subunit S [Peptococcaceae bacterium]